MTSVELESDGPPYRAVNNTTGSDIVHGDLIRIAEEAGVYYATTASAARRGARSRHTRAEIESYEAAKKNAISFISDILTARGVNVATVHIEPCPLLVDQDADHLCTYNGVPVFGARKSGYVMDEWRAQADRLCAPPGQAWDPAVPACTMYMVSHDRRADSWHRDVSGVLDIRYH